MDTPFTIESPEEQVLVDRILNSAQELFLTLGVRSVTMDDLAGHLGVSKKTLYRFIPNKADLVRYCVEMELESAQVRIRDITASSGDAIEEMLLMGAMVIETLKRFNAITIFELKKFYPESWILVERHHTDFILDIIRNNLLKGISEGLYRPEINVEILSRIYIGKSQMLLDVQGDGPHAFNPSEIYMEFFNYHIRGIASPSGVAKLAIYKNKFKLNV